jgi:hypothetical protein
MKKNTLRIFLVVLIACVLPAIAGNAGEEKYLLRYGTQDVHIDYSVDEKATLNLFADNFPLPGASVDIKDIEMRSVSVQYIEISGYNAETDTMTMAYGLSPSPQMWLGYDFFKLPPVEDFVQEIFEMLGKPFSESDMMNIYQPGKIRLEITPQGELMGFDMDLPAEPGMQDDMVMSMIENYATMLFEPDYPSEPIPVGTSWTQKIKLDQIPLAGLKPCVVNYTLKKVDKTPCGKTFATIGFDVDWHQDFTQFNEYVIGEKFEYYEDKEFEVASFNPSIDVKVEGEYLMNLTAGYIVSGDANSEFVIALETGLMKTSGHNRGEVWKPRLEYSIFTQEHATATSACSGQSCDEEKEK